MLVIASEVEKAGQNYTAVLFDSKGNKVLDSSDSFGLAPMVRDGYLITGDSSRVKSETSINYFQRIKSDKFVTLGSWYEAVPYHQSDPGEYSCEVITAGTTSYTFEDDYSGEKPPADIIIFEGNMDDDAGEIADAWKDRKVFAKIYLRSKKKFDPLKQAGIVGDAETYLFEKLTGLPGDLSGVSDDAGLQDQSGQTPSGTIESEVTMHVTGDPAAVKLLTSKR